MHRQPEDAIPLLRKVLRDLRGSTLGFGLSGALMAVFVVVLHPSLRDELAEVEYPEEVGRAIGVELANLGDARVFFSVEFFSWIPLLLIVYAYRAASAHLAGEEAAGTLDLILSQPVTRRRVLLETAAGIGVGTLAVCGCCALGFAVAWPAGDAQGLSLGETVGVCFLMALLLGNVVALTLLAAAVAPSRGWATGTALGALVVTYFFFVLAGLDDSLRGLQYASPFYYAGLPSALTEGVSAPRSLMLVATGTIFLGLALLAFDRRELRAGALSMPLGWRHARSR